jgi:hypothetical protein
MLVSGVGQNCGGDLVGSIFWRRVPEPGQDRDGRVRNYVRKLGE